MFKVSFSLKSKRPFLELLILSCLLALAILYGVKSWSSYFFTGLAYHWDPKIMGEWMAWNAHNILHGHFLVPNYNVNFFYPHSYALAFSEMLWPESFIYAIFYALTGNPFFSFNSTMLFFWTLSGTLMFIFLKSLDISALVSAFGSFVYCLMPFRMPYYVEFNMVLIFIFPLMLLLLKQWLKDPTWKTALWFCLGYFISATSCLYYTIMAIIIMIFVFIAFYVNDRSLRVNRKFYLSGILIVFCSLVISAIFLYPYALLHLQGGYERSIADYLKYFAQPIQYLDTGSAPLLRWIKIPSHHFAETFLFPGTVLCFLVLVFFLFDAFYFLKNYSTVKKTSRYIAWAKLLLWFLFWAAVLIQSYSSRASVSWLKPFNPYLYHISFLLIFLYIAGIFFNNNQTLLPRILLTGMATAAVVCFFVSFGPFISIGPDTHRLVLARGPFLDMASWDPLFSAVRGLTRFSIVILTYLTVAGCFVLNQLVQKNKKVLFVLPILLAVLIYDARHMMKYKFEDCRPFVNSKVIKEAQNLPGKYVLFMLPVAIRNTEADLVMTTIGKFPLLINGWSGFNPKSYEQLYFSEKKDWDLNKIDPWVEKVWPPAYLIIDKTTLRVHELGWRMPFPWKEFDNVWELVDKGPKYSLYRQKRSVITGNKIEKLVRTDILKKNSILCFKAHATGKVSAFMSVSLNHKEVASKITLAKGWKEYTIPLPLKDMGNIEGEEIDIKLSSHIPHSWEVKDIEFRPSP